MISITNDQFNKYIDEFNRLLINNLCLTTRTSNLKILNNYIRSIKNGNYKSYTLISLQINDNIIIDFTISFHDFYSVPILYFKFYINNQLTLSIDKILEFQQILGIDKNIGLVVDTHQLLNDPWISIHPCETLVTIDKFLSISMHSNNNSEGFKTLEYLVCWFNIYGLSGLFTSLGFRPNIQDL